MTDTDIAAIRARADKATPGPWGSHEYVLGSHAQHDVLDCQGDENYYKRGIARANHGRTADEANALFIAAARADVPALCDALDVADMRMGAALRILNDGVAGIYDDPMQAIIEARNYLKART